MEQASLIAENTTELQEKTVTLMSNDESWRHKLPLFKNALGELLAKDPLIILARVYSKATFAGFLAQLPAPLNQEYNCRCCEEFFEDYADVVVVRHDGTTYSPLFTQENAPEGMEAAYAYVEKAVAVARVRDFFSRNTRRKPTKGNPKYTHWGIAFTPLVTAADVSAKRNFTHEINTIIDGFVENTAYHAQRAVRLLQQFGDNSVIRKHISLLNVYAEAYTVYKDKVSANMSFNAMARRVIEVDALYHFRNTAPGTLIRALAESEVGSAEEKSAMMMYLANTDPVSYKRATTEASQQKIAQAEKWFVENGYSQSLDLRLATIDDCSGLDSIWQKPAPVVKEEKHVEGGLFSALVKDDSKKEADLIKDLPKLERQLGEVTITRFIKDILPNALRIGVFSQGLHPEQLNTAVTQVNKDAKPIYKNDAYALQTQQKRIPTFFTIRVANSSIHQVLSMWGVEDTVMDVKSVAIRPDSGESEPGHNGLIFLTEDIKPKFIGKLRPTYFPESLTQELQEWRDVMENLIQVKGFASVENPVGAVAHQHATNAHYIVETETEHLIFRLGAAY